MSTIEQAREVSARLPINVKHGHSRPHMQHYSTYRSWASMKTRCQKPNHISFKFYGAIGITVCAEWDDFEAFLRDMGERPDGTSIDRIDQSLGYFKENCKCSTPKEQANNTRRNRVISAFGKSMTTAQWSDETRIPRDTLKARLDTGWEAERALSTPVRKMVWRNKNV